MLYRRIFVGYIRKDGSISPRRSKRIMYPTPPSLLTCLA
jgi:hypothetical protein